MTRINHVGEKKKMNCGLEAEVIAYRKYSDIDIRFENGVIKEHVGYQNFITGKCSPVSYKERFADSRIGVVKRMNNGMDAKVIAYHSSKDVTIQFSDGTIKENVSYDRFEKGRIAHPDLAKIKTGQKKMMSCGLEAEIIRYAGAHDMDVCFSDGVVRKHVSYANFSAGYIMHPDRDLKNRNGQEFVLPSSEKVTITDYRDSRHVEISFADGAKKIVEYRDLKNGTNILHPLQARQDPREHIGETARMNCGVDAQILSYKKKKCKVRFEDGYEKEVFYSAFAAGQVLHPAFHKMNTQPFGGYIPTRKAYMHEKDTYYFCKCLKCGKEHILTPKEMLSNVCNC